MLTRDFFFKKDLFFICRLVLLLSLVTSKGEMDPERKETRQKVDEDRKHEYPFH